MQRVNDFAATAASYASSASRYRIPPQVLLGRILSNIERIQMLRTATPSERQAALDIAWDAYARVLSTIDSDSDESWGGARQIGTSYQRGLDIIDDTTLADLLMYGEADDDGRGD